MTTSHYWMWFDNSSLPLADKIGRRPVVCKLNAVHVNGQDEIEGIVLEPVGNVPVNNFLFGGKNDI